MDDRRNRNTLVSLEKMNGLMLQQPLPIETSKDTSCQPNTTLSTTNTRNLSLSYADTQQHQSIQLHRSCCFNFTDDKKTRHNRKISLQEMLQEYRTTETNDPAQKALPHPQETTSRRFRSLRRDAAATNTTTTGKVAENDSEKQRLSATLGMSSQFRSMKKLTFDPNHETTEEEQEPSKIPNSPMHNSWTFLHEDAMAPAATKDVDESHGHGALSNGTRNTNAKCTAKSHGASSAFQNQRFQKRQTPEGQRSWNVIRKSRPHILRTTTLDHAEKFGASMNFGDLLTFIEEQQPENADDDSDNVSMNPEELFREEDEESDDDNINNSNNNDDEDSKTAPNNSNQKIQDDSNCSLHLSATMIISDEKESEPFTEDGQGFMRALALKSEEQTTGAQGRTKKFYSRRRSARNLIETQKNVQRSSEDVKSCIENSEGIVTVLQDNRKNNFENGNGKNHNGDLCKDSVCVKENEKEGSTDRAETEKSLSVEMEHARTSIRAGSRVKKHGNGNILSRRNGQLRTKHSASSLSLEKRNLAKLHQSWSGEFW
jgi:hypothetical protein